MTSDSYSREGVRRQVCFLSGPIARWQSRCSIPSSGIRRPTYKGCSSDAKAVGVMSLLAFRDVSRRLADGAYGVAMLDRVSFGIDAGEAVGLWVPRLEKGGTVLLRIAAGLEVPDEGAVCWDGQVLSGMSADER